MNYLSKFYRSFSLLAMIWLIVTAVTGRNVSRASAIGVIIAALIVAAIPDDWFEKVVGRIKK